MRWFLFSILVLYFWFTPGAPFLGWEALGKWWPSNEGVLNGLTRIAALLVIIFAVTLVLQTTSRESFLSGVVWLIRPLRCLGLNPERAALRISLTFGALEHVSEIVDNVKRDVSVPNARNSFRKLGGLVRRLFDEVISASERVPLESVQITSFYPETPPTLQWIWLAGLVVYLCAATALQATFF